MSAEHSTAEHVDWPLVAAVVGTISVPWWLPSLKEISDVLGVVAPMIGVGVLIYKAVLAWRDRQSNAEDRASASSAAIAGASAGLGKLAVASGKVALASAGLLAVLAVLAMVFMSVRRRQPADEVEPVQPMKITGGRVYDSANRPVRFVRANAFGGAQTPRFIVLHDTAGRDRKFSSVDWFASKQCPHSAHFVVERDGTVTQMVPTDRRAWHAGDSTWRGVRYLNSCSVGIEIVNPGKMDAAGRAWFGQGALSEDIEHRKTPEHGDGHWLPYTPAQIEAVTALCRAVVEEYSECNEIVTHWEISPRRKIDTNPLFPLDALRKAVFEPTPDGEPADSPEAAVSVEASPAAKPSVVEAGAKSVSVRMLAGAGVAWVEGKLGLLKSILPEANTDATAIVGPLTSLGGMLRANVETLTYAVVLVTIVVVMYRHARDKAELTHLRGDTP